MLALFGTTSSSAQDVGPSVEPHEVLSPAAFTYKEFACVDEDTRRQVEHFINVFSYLSKRDSTSRIGGIYVEGMPLPTLPKPPTVRCRFETAYHGFTAGPIVVTVEATEPTPLFVVICDKAGRHRLLPVQTLRHESEDRFLWRQRVPIANSDQLLEAWPIRVAVLARIAPEVGRARIRP